MDDEFFDVPPSDTTPDVAAESTPEPAPASDTPTLDFGNYDDAAAQADKLGGTVVAIGTAYHVELPG